VVRQELEARMQINGYGYWETNLASAKMLAKSKVADLLSAPEFASVRARRKKLAAVEKLLDSVPAELAEAAKNMSLQDIMGRVQQAMHAVQVATESHVRLLSGASAGPAAHPAGSDEERPGCSSSEAATRSSRLLQLPFEDSARILSKHAEVVDSPGPHTLLAACNAEAGFLERWAAAAGLHPGPAHERQPPGCPPASAEAAEAGAAAAKGARAVAECGADVASAGERLRMHLSLLMVAFGGAASLSDEHGDLRRYCTDPAYRPQKEIDVQEDMNQAPELNASDIKQIIKVFEAVERTIGEPTFRPWDQLVPEHLAQVARRLRNCQGSTPDYEKRRVLKEFDEGPFEGTVEELWHDPSGTTCYTVVYDDGDLEDMYLEQLLEILIEKGAAQGGPPGAGGSTTAATAGDVEAAVEVLEPGSEEVSKDISWTPDMVRHAVRRIQQMWGTNLPAIKQRYQERDVLWLSEEEGWRKQHKWYSGSKSFRLQFLFYGVWDKTLRQPVKYGTVEEAQRADRKPLVFYSYPEALRFRKHGLQRRDLQRMGLEGKGNPRSKKQPAGAADKSVAASRRPSGASKAKAPHTTKRKHAGAGPGAKPRTAGAMPVLTKDAILALLTPRRVVMANGDVEVVYSAGGAAVDNLVRNKGKWWTVQHHVATRGTRGGKPGTDGTQQYITYLAPQEFKDLGEERIECRDQPG
ncbi:hypothetical protein CYMTET_12777, partial [Cymbomonas tetramitiformis]